ncbi:MAG: TIGR03915 family putative DNA repair protein [Candidatus Coproplasma sp.]
MKFFLVDSSESCFYTAVFDAYRERECIITSEKNLQLGFGDKLIEVSTDANKAERVKNRLNEYDPLAADDISLILRSCECVKEQTAFEYVKLIVKLKQPVRTMSHIPAVLEALDLRSKVTGEIHRMKGFLRFMENDRGVLYAPYSPDNDITDLLAPHFAERFKNQQFVIHDIKRKIAAMYDGINLVMFNADGADVYLSEYEKTFENLWKLYYKSVNIAERPHEKQMKGYMPVRYWKFLPEKHE